jgi:hypothetical protein
MQLFITHCPLCGHPDLAPREILIGRVGRQGARYRSIFTLKCQHCGWLGEQPAESHTA